MRLWQDNFELLGMMTAPSMGRDHAIEYYLQHFRDVTGEFAPRRVEAALLHLHGKCLEWVATPEEYLNERPYAELQQMFKTLDTFADVIQATAHRLNAPKVLSGTGFGMDPDAERAARFFTTIQAHLEDMRKDIKDIGKNGLIQAGKSQELFQQRNLLGRFAATQQEKAMLAIHAMIGFTDYRKELDTFLATANNPELTAAMAAIGRATISYAKEEIDSPKALEILGSGLIN